MPQITTSLRDQLRERREALGLSQAEVARAMGCSQPRVSQLENGLGGKPTWDEVIKYATAVGVNIHELLHAQ